VLVDSQSLAEFEIESQSLAELRARAWQNWCGRSFVCASVRGAIMASPDCFIECGIRDDGSSPSLSH
jgi:hypothetical protein